LSHDRTWTPYPSAGRAAGCGRAAHPSVSAGGAEPIVWSEEEKPIVDQLRGLRSLDEKKRAKATLQLALRIRKLDPAAHKELLAEQLANLATEGDAGHKTLQEVAATLAQALKESRPRRSKTSPTWRT
jgi:hypothetical protein